MVIKIKRDQPELKFTLVEPGREGRGPASVKNIRLVVTVPPPPPDAQLSRIIRKGACGYPPVEPPEVDVYPEDRTALPALVYPAMGFDKDGAVIFRLDKLMWSRPCGRYLGRIEVGDDWAATFDLDLHPIRWTLEGVET